MSSKQLVRQPIRDREDRIIGYEMVYHGESQAFHSEGDAAEEFAMADTVCSVLTKSSINALREATNFMTFSTTLLMKKVPQLFEPENLVIQIDDSVVIHPLSMHFVEQYARQGYQIAVNEFEFTPRYMGMMDRIDYIRVDMTNESEENLKNLVEIARAMKKHCIMTRIQTERQYRLAYQMGADYFEGPYVTTRLRWKPAQDYLNSEFFQLFREIVKDVPNAMEAEKRIASSPTFSYSLMKMVCSEYFSLKNRPSTVHQALKAMDLSQLKIWAFLLGVNPSQPDEGMLELVQLSLMRGRFYQELMKLVDNIPLSESEGYLMGMFTALELYAAEPMENIVRELMVSGAMQRALVHHEGPCGKLCSLLLSYELGDWKQVRLLSGELGIGEEDLLRAYFTSLSQVGNMWKQLNTPYTE